jgi:uncharacterized BrkB/YihY/UPF0761 family membrane protein
VSPLVRYCSSSCSISSVLRRRDMPLVSAASRSPSRGLRQTLTVFKLAAVPISIFTLFLVYWLLPNCKVPPARVVPAAMIVLSGAEWTSRRATEQDPVS